MLDAYHVLYNGKFKSPKQIRDSFFNAGKPLLTMKQSETIFRRMRQSGGQEAPHTDIINEAAQSLLDMAAGIKKPGNVNIDPRAVEAAQKAAQMIQAGLRVVLPFVFILNTLENSPMFGDLIGAALDVTAATLPILAITVQATTPAIVGLLPIPEAGEVGIIVGWLFSLWFLWIGAVIALSRKDFSGALEATAGMIPVIGASAMKSVKSVDEVVTKFANRAEKIMESVMHAYGSVMSTVNDIKSKIPADLTNLADLKSKLPANLSSLPKLPAGFPSMPVGFPNAPTPAPAPVPAPTPVPAPPLPLPETKKSFAPMQARRTGGRKRKNTARRTRRNTRRGLKVGRAYK